MLFATDPFGFTLYLFIHFAVVVSERSTFSFAVYHLSALRENYLSFQILIPSVNCYAIAASLASRDAFGASRYIIRLTLKTNG